MNRGIFRPDDANFKAKWMKAVDSAAFDDRTRCLALLSLLEGTIQIYTVDSSFTMLRLDSSIPVPYLPKLTAIRLVPGRKVNFPVDKECRTELSPICDPPPPVQTKHMHAFIGDAAPAEGIKTCICVRSSVRF
jgi:hypothetical protein